MSRLTNVTAKTSEVFYSDFTVQWFIHPQKRDLLKNQNENAVRSAIRNLINTNRGERLFQPDIGTDIRALLFENFSPQVTEKLQMYIRDTIRNYEPRANIISVQIAENYDQNSYLINIIFSTINSATPITLPIILERLR